MTLTCIALDDTPFDLEALCDTITKHDSLQLKGSFKNVADAQEFLETNTVDLIFSDIEMPDTDGLEFVKQLTDAPAVVFVSSHSELAIEGFNVAAVDFISKPLTAKRFDVAMKRVEQYFGIRNHQMPVPVYSRATQPERDFFVIKDGHDLVRLCCNDLIYAEANGDFVNLHTDNKKYLVLVTMKGLLTQIPEGTLVRCHKSYMVNPSYMHRLNLRSLHLTNNVIVPVGKEFAQAVETEFTAGRLVKRKA